MMARINLETLDIEIDSPSELVWVDGSEALNFVRRHDARKDRVQIWDSSYGDGVSEQLCELFGGEVFEAYKNKGWIPPANVIIKHVQSKIHVVYNKETHSMAFVRLEDEGEKTVVKPFIPTKDILYATARWTLLDYLKAIPEDVDEC